MTDSNRSMSSPAETAQSPQPGEQSLPAHASEAVTNWIRVRIEPRFLPSQSSTGEGQWVFAYRVTITNEGNRPARLLSRRWRIIDGAGKERTVEGEGVVGRQPNLAPGESFTYESFCPLDTAWGTMEGSYRFTGEDGGEFDAAIARFYLVAPAG